MAEGSITPGIDQLKALTHPVRVRMLGMLRIDGPATATTLATRLGLNSGATSYHLRQLAQHGFIVDDETRGNGRERWWRAAHGSTLTNKADLPPEEKEALDAYLQSVSTIYAHQLQQAMEERPLLPQEWREASTFSDWTVRITASQAKALLDRIDELLQGAEETDDGEVYVFQLNGYPLPGRLGTAPDEGPGPGNETEEGR
ncbi:helix-turn-helix domain-containing protein [Nocardioides sp. KR10-350]|uniref:helix-turn-helix domain-containing protein n=1 Tax=Nocardioides cheoyonin TaxID=3156615 RepID=UPI0032B36F4D